MPLGTGVWAAQILAENANKNFVQRILQPEKWPIVSMGKGVRATEQMGWTTVDGKHIVYPNIVYDPSSKGLRWLAPKEAVDYALRTGEYIPFRSSKEADLFSRKYKSAVPRNFRGEMSYDPYGSISSQGPQ